MAKRMTAEEYLAAERAAEFKSEFWLGQVSAMAGGIERHAEICQNLARFLGNRLAGKPCKVYGSDMKVGLAKKRGFSYPDVSVTCGERKFYDAVRDVLTNPTAIFEVLSDSTRAFDLGRKFEEYQRLGSLRHYFLVETERRSVAHYQLSDSGHWIYERWSGAEDVLKLLGVELPLAEVYDQIDFEPEADIE